MVKMPIIPGDTWRWRGEEATVLDGGEAVRLGLHSSGSEAILSDEQLYREGSFCRGAFEQCREWLVAKTVLARRGPRTTPTMQRKWQITWMVSEPGWAVIAQTLSGLEVPLRRSAPDMTRWLTPHLNPVRANDFHVGDEVRVRVNDHIEVGRLVKVDPPSGENAWTTWYHVETDFGTPPCIVTRKLLPAVPDAAKQGQPDAFAIGDRVLVHTDTGLRSGHVRRIVPPRAGGGPAACGPYYHVEDEQNNTILITTEDGLIRRHNQTNPATIELLQPPDMSAAAKYVTEGFNRVAVDLLIPPPDEKNRSSEKSAYSMFQVVFPDGHATSCESVRAFYSYPCHCCGSPTTGPFPALPCERCFDVRKAAYEALHLPAAMAQAIASLPPDDELVPALRRIDDTLRAALDIGRCGRVRQEKLEVVLDEARFAIAVAAEACVATPRQRHGQRFLAQLEIAAGGAHAALMAGRRGLAAPRPPVARTPSPPPLVVCDHGWNDDDAGIDW